MSDFSCEGDFSSTDGGGPSKKNSTRGEMAINFSSADERVQFGNRMDFSDTGQSRLGMDFSEENSQLQHRHSTSRARLDFDFSDACDSPASQIRFNFFNEDSRQSTSRTVMDFSGQEGFSSSSSERDTAATSLALFGTKDFSTDGNASLMEFSSDNCEKEGCFLKFILTKVRLYCSLSEQSTFI